MTRTIEQAREEIARRAKADGYETFTGEVLAGAWDHRNDVQAALEGRPLKDTLHPDD